MLPDVTKTQESQEKEIAYPPQQGDWTYDDYARLPENGFRYEVIRGEIHMSPAPRPRHQIVVTRLAYKLWQFVEQNNMGEVIASPVDVILGDLGTPVQPDLIFIAQSRLDIISEQKIEGSPDLIVEVLSPGSVSYDRQTKYEVYAQARVQEYWLIDPDNCIVEVHVLRGRAYVLLGRFGAQDTIRSERLSDLQLAVADVCPESRPQKNEE